MARTVQDVMTRDVVVTTAATSFKGVVELIEKHRVGALPVVDNSSRLIGIVSEADLVLKEELPGRLSALVDLPRQRRIERAKAAATRVEEVMTRRVVTASPDTPLAEAARLLHVKRVGQLPVVDSAGRLVGIVTRHDLLRVFLEDDETLAAEVVAEAVDTLPPALRDAVHVAVSDGVVTLSGRVDRRSTALALARRARAVPGVVGVVDDVAFEHDDTVATTGFGP